MEARDRLIRRGPTVGKQVGRSLYKDLLWEMVEKYETRRDFHFLASRERKQSRPAGKENIMPNGMVTTTRRGILLSGWHPRTPLRDITAIVNAVERRRAAMKLAARQRRKVAQTSSPIALTESPAVIVKSSADATQSAWAKPCSSTPLAVVDKPSSSTPLTTAGLTVAFMNSPRTPFTAVLDNSAQKELEMKLEKSIEVIEKAVKENMKRTPNMKFDGKGVRLKTLKSMR